MRRGIVLVAASGLAFGLAACGSGDDTTEETTGTETTDTETTDDLSLIHI